MKIIFRIARLELSTLFYSPIAWLVLSIFTFQTGLEFADLVHQAINIVKLQHLPIPQGLTITLSKLFGSVEKNLYLYIPLLTMGLMSREISSGSIKLLFSSPVTIYQIILGKYVAVITYGFLMVIILLIFSIAGSYFIIGADFPLLLSGIFGLYLLICVYTAIGLMLSSFTSYQVVAAISTFAVLALLNFIGTLWQHVPIIRDISYYLSLNGRCDQFIKGLISSKNVFYFLIVALLFLGLTILILQSRRESKSLLIKFSRYLLLTGVVFLIGFISSRPGWILYVDMTARKTQTVSKNSQDVLRSIKQPLKITAYVNFLDPTLDYGLPEVKNLDQTFFEPYQRFLPEKIQMNYVYYYDSCFYTKELKTTLREHAKVMADYKSFDFNELLPPAEIRKVLDVNFEQGRFLRQFEMGNKRSYVRVYKDIIARPLEAEIMAGLKRLVVPAPRIGFLSGNNERSVTRTGPKDYNAITNDPTNRFGLINQGFDITEVPADSFVSPKDIDVLVIADPKLGLTALQQQKILKYIELGGNMVIAGEPGRQAELNPLLKTLGVQLLNGEIIQQHESFAPDFIEAEFAKDAAGIREKFGSFYSEGSKISMPGAVGLAHDENGTFHIVPVITSNKNNTWNRLGILNLDSGKVTFDSMLGDKKESLPLALSLSRKFGSKEQRIMIIGDADFMNNDEIDRHNIKTENYSFVMEMFSWLCYDAFPINTEIPLADDNKMRITRRSMPLVRGLFMGVLPGLLLFAGTFLLIKRRRK